MGVRIDEARNQRMHWQGDTCARLVIAIGVCHRHDRDNAACIHDNAVAG
jgi:hypothetical protein